MGSQVERSSYGAWIEWGAAAMSQYGFKPERIDASCLINVDRKLTVWKHGNLIMFNINGSGVVLHDTDAVRLAKGIQEWMKT